MKLITIIVFFISPTLNLDFEHSEQCEWPQQFPDCGGLQQSPIELNMKDAQEYKNAKPLKFHEYNKEIPGDKWLLQNNGHSLRLSISPEYNVKPTVQGGFLPGIFNFLGLHFHWGSKDTYGSEHVMDKKYFSLEMHMVHWNNKYKSFEEARKNKDGLAVLGVFFLKSDKKQASSISKITNVINNVIYYGNVTHIKDSLSLDTLFPVKKNNYFTYHGSLTIPPCIEVITWTVFYQYLSINAGDLAKFRTIYDSHNQHIVDNFRKVQRIGERVVGVVKN